MNVAVVLVAALNFGVTLSWKAIHFRVREVSNDTVDAGVEPRIYIGSEAMESQFPFMVYVMIRRGEGLSLCSASLVRPSWVLLAAHCFSVNLRPEDVLAIGGRAHLSQYVRWRQSEGFEKPVDEQAFGLQERRGRELYIHPEYDPKTYYHDVALIEVNKPFVLGPVETIPVSEEKMDQEKHCTILGWGLEYGNIQKYQLNFVEKLLVKTTSIGCLYKSEGPFICLQPSNQGICMGDSGSPLVCDGKVWGVTSHMVSYSDKPDCGDSMEEYYSEIYEDLEWLRSVYSSAPSQSAVPVPARILLIWLLAGLWLSGTA